MKPPWAQGDLAAADRALAAALASYRARTDALARMTAAEESLATSPLPEWLVDGELLAALRERAADALGGALLPWFAVLGAEHALYPERFAIAVGWGTPRPVRGRAERVSPREMRRELLSASHETARAQAAADFAALARPLADRARGALERRIELGALLPAECRSLAVAELPDEPGMMPASAWAAEQLLAQSEEICAERRAGPWHEGLAIALGRDAASGWPARLSARWLSDVLARDFDRGLRLGPIRVPAAFGALSYGRALGSLGMRFFEAARPQSLPWALHQHPLGARKHLRRALFASILFEPSFLTRVLGLGAGSARDQRRAIARAMLAGLRVDAWRVACVAAAAKGLSRARERYLETGERVVGHGLPALFGVLPVLRPGDGAALVGALLSAEVRAQLIERHDEDWFRNPRALAELRHEDSLARDPAPIPRDRLKAAIARIVREAEQAIG